MQGTIANVRPIDTHGSSQLYCGVMDRVVALSLMLGVSVTSTGIGGATGCEKKADASAGRRLFVSTCARCHGAEGTGGVPLFDGGPSPRNFHDHDFQKARTDEQLKLTIMNGKGTAMPQFGTSFSDAQITSLVRQVRSFDGASGDDGDTGAK